ncbi:MAG TPA: tripartite tricarboxylate transporter substrate binding protein [Burkholderiales bacterium]|nr:tripartite tricarboxylate transporter substrate binding protein [Burkholderiales bacterium]
MRLLVFLLLFPIAAWAQPYPSKPVRIICSFPVGGIADIYGRIIAAKLAESWGQPIVIDTRAGAGGVIAAEAGAKAAADGYTLVIGSVGTHAVNVSLFSKLPYDAVKDFAAIVLLLEAEGLLVVHPSLPAQNVAELISLAKAKPLSFASAGMGSASHLAGELFKSMAHVDMTHVPYKGNVPAITDLLAGQTSLLFATMPTVLPHAKAGKLRALATMGNARAAVTPELPTIGESLKGFEVNNWIGLFAPAGTPPEIVRRWNTAVSNIMLSPEIQARLPGEGAKFAPNTPEQFSKFVVDEIAKWAPVVRASGARVD